jgi:hypothetical protein
MSECNLQIHPDVTEGVLGESLWHFIWHGAIVAIKLLLGFKVDMRYYEILREINLPGLKIPLEE